MLKKILWKNLKEKHLNYLKDLLNKIKIDFITFLNNLEVVTQEEIKVEAEKPNINAEKNNPKCLLVIKKNEKISRNEKCPATGKKYKHCCGAL